VLECRLLERAGVACYPRSSLRELPPAWIDTAFVRHNGEYCLCDPWKACVEFRLQDIRTDSPSGPFDLVLCRNVAFTYFEESVQQRIVLRLAEAISTNGFLVVGRRESLPSGAPFVCDTPGLGIYRRAPVGGA